MQRAIMSNEIRIAKVANGYTVSMPSRIEVYSPVQQENFADSIKAGLEAVAPWIREIQKKQQEDPLLAELVESGADYQPDPEPERPESKEPKELIGQDNALFVCPTFGHVLALLEEYFKGED
jgi:hypothetical protein